MRASLMAMAMARMKKKTILISAIDFDFWEERPHQHHRAHPSCGAFLDNIKVGDQKKL